MSNDDIKPYKERITSRPRLFFTPERMKSLHEQVDNNAVIKEAWQNMLQRADKLLEAKYVSEDYAEKGSGQHGNYGAPSSQVQNMGSTLGLAYQMTGERHYAEKLRDALLYYGNYKRWCGINFTKWDPPWYSELNTARFCYGYAVGYDCISDFLSSEDRSKIANSMIHLGIDATLDDWVLPGKRVHALDSMGHNWWSVCVAMAGLAVISILGDEPGAEKLVQKITRAFSEWFYYQGNILQNKTKNFDKDGAFYESVNYANYALSEYLLFRLAYLNTFPDSLSSDDPLLQKVGDFFLHTCYPTTDSILSANFGDSGISGTGARTMRLLVANGYGNENYHWYLERTDQGLGDPMGLVYYQPDSISSAPYNLPESAIYSDIGWAVMRSSWEDDATMLAVKSGFTWNHAHADAGSYILLHAGKPLIIDSGACSYGRPEYTGYYCQSEAHNVVLFNGKGQSREDIPRGVKIPGTVNKLIDMGSLKYVFADATGPTSQNFLRNFRHFLWIDGVILIFDDLRSHTSGKFEWLLHYEGEAEICGSDICLTNESAKAVVRPLFPGMLSDPDMAVELSEKEGLKDHSPDEKVCYFSLSPKEDMQEKKFVTAVIPMETNGTEHLPHIEKLQADEMIGLRIRKNGMISDIYMNLRADGRRMHRNSNKSLLGWETDAYLVAITRPEGSDEDDPDSVTRYFIACGSYLRRDGKVIFDSLSKAYTAFTTGQPKMEVVLQGQPLMEIALRNIQKPDKVIVNGENIDFNYDQEDELISFIVGKRL